MNYEIEPIQILGLRLSRIMKEAIEEFTYLPEFRASSDEEIADVLLGVMRGFNQKFDKDNLARAIGFARWNTAENK